MVVDGPTIDELHTMGPYFYCLLPRRVTLTRQEIASQVEIAMVQTSAMGQPKRSRSQKTDRRLSEAAIPMTESTLVVEEPMQWLSLQATFPQCLKHLPYLGSLWIVAFGEGPEDVAWNEPLGPNAQGCQAVRPNVPPNRLITHIEVGSRLGHREFLGHVHDTTLVGKSPCCSVLQHQISYDPPWSAVSPLGIR